MSLQVEKMEKNMAKLTIEVSAEDLDKAMQNAYQKAKGRISIPGFRKGKFPMEEPQGQNRFFERCAEMLLELKDELERNLYIEAIVKKYRG